MAASRKPILLPQELRLFSIFFSLLFTGKNLRSPPEYRKAPEVNHTDAPQYGEAGFSFRWMLNFLPG